MAEKREMPPLPARFLERMQGLLQEAFEPFLQSYAEPPVTALRVNTLKISPETFKLAVPWSLAPIPGVPAGFLVRDEGRPGRHPYHAAGLYYLQDPAAMLVAEIIDPQPGQLVLDLAAAPGGKATHIAARLQGEGLLVANEINRSRVWDLAENLERWGAANVCISNESPERLAQHLPAFFDTVVLDAPCSGEGMFQRSAAAREAWSPELVKGCALRQSRALESAAALTAPGGKLVYITCTFAPEENEAVVARFLQEHRAFELEAVPTLPGTSRGRPDWVPNPLAFPDLEHCVRVWPHENPGEGHFIAVLRRGDASVRVEPRLPVATRTLSGSARRLLESFWSETFADTPDLQHTVLHGTHLYTIAERVPALSGLRIVHPGRWLGTLKKGRFEPAHALALSIQLTQARRVVDFDPEEKAVLAYLLGHTLDVPGSSGWLLIAVGGFPLGWGKRVGTVIKNHYPKGLRWT